MALDRVLSGGSPDFVILDDWMPRPGDKLEVRQLIEKALTHLDDSHAAALKMWFIQASVERR